MLYTLRSGATQHTEDSVLQLVTDLIDTAGVFDLSSSNHFLVQAQDTPDMTVKVNIGRAFIKKTGSNAYPVRSTEVENVAVDANSSGNNRIDTLVLYIDLSASPVPQATNVAKLKIVKGTPAASPTAPSDADIATDIGSSNPYIEFADIAVANGASSIIAGNITDMRGAFKPYNSDEAIVPLTDGATIDINGKKGTKFSVILGGNRALTFSNLKNGRPVYLEAGQDGTGGRLISSWPTTNFTFLPGDVNASTDVITVGKNIKTGTPIVFTNAGGGAPAGITAGTVYYAINASATTIKVATTLANAQAGTAIDITTAGTGTHTCAVKIRWAGGSEPSLSTGKYIKDSFIFIPVDVINGEITGYATGDTI